MQGCYLTMHELHPQNAIIDMDCPELQIPLDHRRCDFIFAGATAKTANKDLLAPIEMKRGKANAGELCRQLKAGALFAQELPIPEGMDFQFRPVAVYGGRLHKNERDRLKKNKIPFRGSQYEIKLLRCGSPLAAAFR